MKLTKAKVSHDKSWPGRMKLSEEQHFPPEAFISFNYHAWPVVDGAMSKGGASDGLPASVRLLDYGLGFRV